MVKYNGEVIQVFYPRAYIKSNVSNELLFGVDTTEWLRIKSNGNVGIGTNNPGEKLNINGNLLLGKIGSNSSNTGGLSDNCIKMGAMFSHNVEHYIYSSFKGNSDSNYNYNREIGLMFECSGGGGSTAYGHIVMLLKTM